MIIDLERWDHPEEYFSAIYGELASCGELSFLTDLYLRGWEIEQQHEPYYYYSSISWPHRVYDKSRSEYTWYLKLGPISLTIEQYGKCPSKQDCLDQVMREANFWTQYE